MPFRNERSSLKRSGCSTRKAGIQRRSKFCELSKNNRDGFCIDKCSPNVNQALLFELCLRDRRNCDPENKLLSVVRICPATVISGVIRVSSFKTARSFLPSDGRPALLAQPLGVRLNGAKCRLQRRRYDRRGGMRCFFPRKGSGRDPHCFSLRGDRASPSRCYFLRHHPLQFGTVSRCRSRR